MKFPYGLSDFYKVMTEDYFYIDRTDRIRLLEEAGSQLLFLRPRRFGKSLLLSTLANYYDVAKADEFDQLFGHLAIGQHPTPLHNQYLVLRWDFSMVSPQGTVADIQRSLNNHLNNSIKDFTFRYADILPRSVDIHPDDGKASFESVLYATQSSPYAMYLFIDEYDNFANEVLVSDPRASTPRYAELLYGEGVLKTLFKAVKAGAAGRGLDRVFITGVSPVALSDMTSGYNVAEDIYLRDDFNDLCGFREVEIVTALKKIAAECELDPGQVADALAIMRVFYNGYHFSYNAPEPMYNPTLALYFMKFFQRECHAPREMLDSNLAMDRAKITYISRLAGGETLVTDILAESPPPSIQQLAQRFGVEDMLDAHEDNTFMASLLYYFGVLTLGGTTSLGKLQLRIPNLVVRQLYVERLRNILLPDFRDVNTVTQIAETFC